MNNQFDFVKMREQLKEMLNSTTKEQLIEWLEMDSKRMSQSQSIKDLSVDEKLKLLSSITSQTGWCVSCDQEKVVHEMCLDCALELGRNNPIDKIEISEEEINNLKKVCSILQEHRLQIGPGQYLGGHIFGEFKAIVERLNRKIK